jgi:hypothetical protein
MSEQLYDFFGEIFQRYFRPAIDAYPRMGGALVERLLTLSDDVPDRLAQTRCAATAWAKAETPNARITSELFVITQHGLMYAAGLNESWWTAGSAATSHPRIRWTPRCAGYSMSTWRCGWICPRSYFFAAVFLAGASFAVAHCRALPVGGR